MADTSANSRGAARLLHFTRLFEDVLIVLLVALMVLLAAGQIVLRNIWGVGLVWADPLLRVLVLWVGLLGAMVATRNNNHITIDVLSRWLPCRLKRLSHWITGLFSAAVCSVLAYHGMRFVLMEREAGSVLFAGVPAWLCELIIPIGFGVMAVRFLLWTVLSPEESKRPCS